MKKLLLILICFATFFIGCKSFIPEYYYQKGQTEKTHNQQYEYYRKANVYYMIFSDSYYPGTKKVMESGEIKKTQRVRFL
ncbi:hypothetical protein OAX32_02990 [Flavobacteriales bacterium]|nr:hypothetical protein [Flavobacteriales bacterium]